MNSRAFTLSLVIALIAGFMVYSYIDGMETEFINRYGKPKPVVVAKEDILELELIDDRKVQIINVPTNFIQPGHIQKIEEVYNTIATVPIKKGEQITKPRITHPGSRTGLSNQISIGKRAVAVKVVEEQAVSRLIKPGDRVDLIARVDYANGKKNKVLVKTVFQDALILSTGYSVTNALPMVNIKRENDINQLNLNTYTNYNSVTVELTPQEAQKMVFLLGEGARIFLSLRNNDDKAVERLKVTRIFDVLDEDATEAKLFFEAEEAEERTRRSPRRGR